MYVAKSQEPRAKTKRAFTLVELIASIAILAIVATMALFFIGGYISYSRQTADKQTLAVLNDALNRYKCEGGGVGGLTLGAPIGNVIARLKTPITWAGLSHQFLQNSFTVSARSLKAVGTGHQYHFYNYSTYASETPAAGTATSDMPYGSQVAYMARASAGTFALNVTSSTGYFAVKTDNGTITPYAGGAQTTGSSTYIQIWPCAGAADTTKSGAISNLTCSSNQLTAINIDGMSGLFRLDCSNNPLVSLDFSGLTSLQYLFCYSDQLTSLNVTGCTGLLTIYCNSNQLTTLNTAGLYNLSKLYCSHNQLGVINTTGCTSLPAPSTDSSTNFRIDFNSSPTVTGQWTYP